MRLDIVSFVEHFPFVPDAIRKHPSQSRQKGQDRAFHLAPSPTKFRALEFQSDGRTSRLKPGRVPTSGLSYYALMVIRFRAWAFTSLGSVTVNTPFRNTASALLASTLAERGIDRLKEPYERSARK